MSTQEPPKPSIPLDDSRQLLQLLIDGVMDYAIFMLDRDGIVHSWNSGAQKIKGYLPKEIVGQHFSKFYTEEDRAAGIPARALDSAAHSGRFEAEGWRVRKDGTRFWANVIITAIRDASGNLHGFAKITRDFTERQKANELLEQTRARLFQSQKMEAVGKLTGGVAHDFNNVLQIISGNLQLIESASRDAQTKKWVSDALGAVDRGTRLSAHLLAFARRQPLQPAVINLARLIRGMDALLRHALGATIQIETVIAGGLWNSMVDPHQLENVVLNIAINARDAMRNGGRLTIELGNAMLDDHYALLEPDVHPGQYVLLAITDTGTGMPPEVIEHAFEPFFTTKPEGQGTGLGLSMAHGLVRQSGGHIKIYSEVGHGTTVKIYLPRSFDAETEPAERPGRANAETASGGSETILVVEDDPKVQSVAVDMLSGLGYRVLRADNAQSALSIIRSGVGVDLLFTDVVMPGELHSPELARQAKQYLPDIGVLFTSGYTQNAIVHGGRLDPGVQLLSKPYRREDLARKVRHVLANAKQAALARKPLSEYGRPAAAQQPAQRQEALRILVVEDNAELRDMVSELLGMLGHKAQGVGTAEEALDMLADDGFDVLLTDISLPGVSGIELAKQAVEKTPHLKVIFASGYGAPSSAELGIESVALRKPYDLNELRKALDTV